VAVTDTHDEKETLTVDVNIPGHDARTATPLFLRTRKALIDRDGGRCFVCGRTEQTSGHPLEAHHHPVERSLANMIDWTRVQADCQAGHLGPYAAKFDWSGFTPANPYAFVDDMTVNGLLLCKDHHIGKDEGIHNMPYPLWVAQRYALEGYTFSGVEVIHHEQGLADESSK
jgi:hypothetical protein